MNKKILIGATALAVVIAAGAAAWAHGGKRMMWKQMISAKVAEAEDLIQATPQQRAQIEKSRDAILSALESRQGDRRQMHQKVMTLLTGDSLTEKDLFNLVNEHTSEVQQLAQAIVPEIVKVHDVLTPAQRKTLADKARELHGRRHGPKGGFGGPPEE